MATWVEPIDSQTDPDAPLVSELGKRWDNNVIAAFEGASGAPRLKQAVGASFVNGIDASFDAPSGYRGVYINFGVSGGSGNLVIAFSDNGGSSYAADNTLSLGAQGRLYVNLETGAYYAAGGGTGGSGAFTMPAGTADRFVLRAGGAGEPVDTGAMVEYVGDEV